MGKITGQVRATLVAAGALLLSGGNAPGDSGRSQDRGARRTRTSDGNFFGPTNIHGACTSDYQDRDETNAINGHLCRGTELSRDKTCLGSGQLR
jgi:hypothetical protein